MCTLYNMLVYLSEKRWKGLGELNGFPLFRGRHCSDTFALNGSTGIS